MSVAKKHRRKIVVKEKTYLWVVKQNKDYEGYSLNVFSEDKRFRVSYFLSQADTYLSNLHEDDKLPFLTVKGEHFGGLKKQKTWQNVRTPIWKNDTIITPDFVRTLIEWSLDENKEIILVEYQDFFTELKASLAKLNNVNE